MVKNHKYNSNLNKYPLCHLVQDGGEIHEKYIEITEL